jgi:hypothetical protein
MLLSRGQECPRHTTKILVREHADTVSFVKEVTVAFTTDPVNPSQTALGISARGSDAAQTPQVKAGGISGSGRFFDYQSKKPRPTPPSVAVDFVGFALEDAAD